MLPERDREEDGYRDWMAQNWEVTQMLDIVRQMFLSGRCDVTRERFPASYRTQFIPELKDMIGRNLAAQGVLPVEVMRALEQWEKGAKPVTPTEWACFEVFDTIQKQIDAGR